MGRRRGEIANRYRVSFGGGKNVLKLYQWLYKFEYTKNY